MALLLAVQLAQSGEGLAERRLRNRLSQSDHLELIRNSMPSLENQTLVVCVVVREPFVIYKEPLGVERERAMADLDNYSGVAVEVVKRLASIFKFKIKIVRPQDGQFGVYLAERRDWTGLMGALTRGEADIGLTALSITMSRAHAIDFTRAYYVDTAAILLRSPEEVQNYLAIFEPFSLSVWLCLLTAIVLLILLIAAMTQLEDEQRRQRKIHQLAKFLQRGVDVGQEARRRDGEPMDQEESERRFSVGLGHRLAMLARARERPEFGGPWLGRFYYAITCVLNILLVRDIKHPPRQTPIRILVCVWWLSTIVVVNIYLGILFGQLVVPRRPKSIETLEELVNQNLVEWCVTAGSAIYELFRQSKPSTVYGQLGLRMRNVSSADEGVRRVVRSGWAFIRERSILTFKVAQEHNRLRACKMQFGREDFYSVGFGLGLRKGSSYLGPFNAALTTMIENGFVSRWESMYWPRRNQYTECKLQPAEGQPLSMKHFISIYLVCSLLVSLSASILLYQGLLHEHLFSGLGALVSRIVRGRLSARAK